MIESNDEIALYSKRWFLLAAFCIFSLLTQFLSSSFGISDEILKVYFNVSLTEIDWGLEGLYAGTTLVTPLFAYLCFKDKLGLRVMSIVGTICLLISCLTTILSVIVPILFPVVIVSTFLQGVGFSISLSIGTFFAVLWFPEEQVSQAVTWNIAFVALGMCLGSVLPVVILKSPTYNETDNLAANETTSWIQTTYHTLLFMYITVTIILCLLLVYFVMYVTDLPPKPPTFAMLLKRNTIAVQTEQTLHDFFCECKSLFKDVHFLMMNFVLGVAYNFIVVMILVLSQVVKLITENDDLGISPALLSGLVVSIYSITAVVSGLLVAKCLQCFDIYSVLCKVGTFVQLTSGIIVILSYFYESVAGLFVAVIVLAVGNRLISVPLFVIVTRHTYPISESMVSIWVTGFGTLVFVLLAVTQRILYNAFSTKSVVIAQCVMLLISFVLSLLMKPENKRGEVRRGSLAEANEQTPILSSDL